MSPFRSSNQGTHRRRRSAVLIALALGLATTVAGSDLPWFQDTGPARGIEPYSMPIGIIAGVAAADFDADGDVDFFVPNGLGTPDQLYLNLGDGQFSEIGVAAGVASTAQNRSALWLDIDGDNILELLVGGDCWQIPCPGEEPRIKLYRQVGTTLFEDITEGSGLIEDAGPFEPFEYQRVGFTAGDIDRDGHLDVWITTWCGDSQLFLNDGRGSFSDVTVASGVAAGGPDCYWQPIMHDFNRDGWLDLFSSVDFAANQLWINQQDGTFERVSSLAVGLYSDWNDMGVALGDYDNDGDGDLFVTNIFGVTTRNQFWRNDSSGGTLAFTEIAEPLGVDDTGWGWGTTFLDFDNDGLLDLAATNGYYTVPYDLDPSRFFRNPGAGQAFDDVSAEVAFTDTYWGSSLIAFDMDRDGDLDMLQTTRVAVSGDGPLRLLENQGSPTLGDYLVVRPRMADGNRRAIGAEVRVETGAMTQTRWIAAGGSLLGQEPAEAFFGLGDWNQPVRVEIDWPDGTSTRVGSVAAGQVLDVGDSVVFADGFEGGDPSAWLP